MKKLVIILLFIFELFLRNAVAQIPCYFNNQNSLYYFIGSDSLCEGEFKEINSILNETSLSRYDDGRLIEYSRIGINHSFSIEFYGPASLTLGLDHDKKRDLVTFESPTVVFSAPLNVEGQIKGGYCRTRDDVILFNSPFFRDSVTHIDLRQRKKWKVKWTVGKETTIVSSFKSIHYTNYSDSLSVYIKSPLFGEGLIEVGPRYTYFNGLLISKLYFENGLIIKEIKNPDTKWEELHLFNYKGDEIKP